MTAPTVTQRSLWDAPDPDRRHGQPRPAPVSCALCPTPSASPLGLCRSCLAAAATEHARLIPGHADRDDPRPAAVPFSSLCQRCGRSGHDSGECDA